MPKRVGVFCDISNLYYCIGKKFNLQKLNYTSYIDFLADLGDIQVCNAYGAQMDGEATNFIRALKQIGFTCFFKEPKQWINNGKVKRKADHDVTIAMDVVDCIDRLDIVVLGTADSDLAPVVHWAMKRGVKVVVFACGIAKELKECATQCIEVLESQLEDKLNEDLR